MAQVTSTEYKIDVADILVPRPLLNELTPYKSGQAIKLTWKGSQRGKSGTFYGYFDHIDSPFIRIGGGTDQSLATLRCYGASYVMKNEGFDTFSGLTADQIAKKIARLFNFSFVCDPHPFVWPTYTQAGKSYWALLVELAKRIGYVVYVLGTTLYFVDRRSAGGLVRIPYAYTINTSPRSATDALVFNPEISSGDGVDHAKAGVYTTNGISDLTGEAIALKQSVQPYYGSTVVQQKFFTRTIANRTPTSIGEAQTYLDAAESLSMFTMYANMSVRGNAGLAPGGLVSLVTPHARYRQFVGTWYVCETTQILKPAAYTTVMEVATDAQGTAGVTPQYGTLNQNSLPPTVFANGGWQTRWSQ